MFIPKEKYVGESGKILPCKFFHMSSVVGTEDHQHKATFRTVVAALLYPICIQEI